MYEEKIYRTKKQEKHFQNQIKFLNFLISLPPAMDRKESEFPDLRTAVAQRLARDNTDQETIVEETLTAIPLDDNPEVLTVLDDGADQETTVEVPVHDRDEADDATVTWPKKRKTNEHETKNRHLAFFRWVNLSITVILGQLAGFSKCGQLAGL